MPDSFRLTTLKALTSALEEITIANGYQHDLADRVHRGRVIVTQEDEIPLVTILEKPVFPEQLPTPGGSAASETKLELLIQGFADDDRRNPTDPAYLLLADVQKRLAVEKLRSDGFDIFGLGERVMSLNIGQGVVRPPDAVVSDTAFFWLPVTLTIGEKFNDPFA
ncbi:hypothetical protein vB_RpoS-V16_55 [Ruegeria phage vB_RpoS-V16]|uniref:tail terminator n=1 Tax=Ruegeria phage vB_RpoS-V16 TaxID=2218618 RepID=UPI000DCAB9C9|nr:tail terminator [Ruegeria phage vB_RpoS-V16]AWY09491.1 hypothetical protein vB_RpoS-V16_55 [Ruegeria phage vB_RpoS-V16]